MHIVIFSLLLNDVPPWKRVDLIYSLFPGNDYPHAFAAQGLDEHIHLVFYAVPLLCLWEGRLCPKESPSAKTTISLTQSAAQWCKIFILSFNKYVLISCGYPCTT